MSQRVNKRAENILYCIKRVSENNVSYKKHQEVVEDLEMFKLETYIIILRVSMRW